jgi:hypothetical protein
MPNAKDLSPQIPKRLLVLGDYGTGKSVFASTFPTPGYLFDIDDGAEIYRGKDFDYNTYGISASSWLLFERDVTRVCKEAREGKYKTIIVDATTALAAIAMERALQIDPKRSSTDGPLWNVHYAMVKNLVEGQLRKILNLSAYAYIVVIGHLHIVVDNDTGAIIRIEPLLPGALSENFPGNFGEVYCAFSRKKEGKTVYYLRTAPKGFYRARSRVSGTEGLLPEEVPNDFPTVEKLLTAAIAKRTKDPINVTPKPVLLKA